jgi:hypothetical protein
MAGKNDFFDDAYQVLKANSFKKKGTTWNKSVNELTRWVINFQKGKSATSQKFDLTVNVGVYINGTHGMIFGNEPDFAAEPSSFFRQRPRFFGMSSNWWEFDQEHDHKAIVNKIALFLSERVIPFLDKNQDFDSLVSYLPIEKWKKIVVFHGEMLRVAVAAVILGKYEFARELLDIISSQKNGWGEKADIILTKMNEINQ